MFCGFFLLIILAAFSRVSRQTVLCPKGHWSPVPAGRVFRGAEISGLNFKISGSDFKIRATNFFLTPMWCLRVENQFSILATKKYRFSVPVLRGVKRSGFFVVWGNVGQGVCLQNVTGNVR